MTHLARFSAFRCQSACLHFEGMLHSTYYGRQVDAADFEEV